MVTTATTTAPVMIKPHLLIPILAAVFMWLGECLAADAKKPNIIFILADDYGWGDPHCYGHPYAKTPNIDQLAKEGTRFTRFYATGITCCPARAGLMTGKLPATFQRYPADFGFGDRVTITELLKKHGYATGHVGKWHMGPNEKSGTYGMDVVGADLTPTLTKRPKEGHKDEHIYDSAMAFIEQHRAGPFYLNVWTHIAHHTITPQQKFVDEFAGVTVDEDDFSDYQREKFQTVRENGGDVNDAMRHYLGEAFTMDQDIGRLLAKLDELGLSENTIVVFSSDQGPPAPKNAIPRPAQIAKAKAAGKELSPENIKLGMRLLGYAGPETRGGKLDDYQGGVLVPFIVRWPGHVPAGRVDEKSVISGADWLPTICAIAGVPIDESEFDGEDASKAILGGVHERGGPLFWKTNTDRSDPAMLWRNWKFFGSSRPQGKLELYDLSSDPGERINLADQHPQLVLELSSKLKAWTDTLPKTYEHGDSKEN